MGGGVTGVSSRIDDMTKVEKIKGRLLKDGVTRSYTPWKRKWHECKCGQWYIYSVGGRSGCEACSEEWRSYLHDVEFYSKLNRRGIPRFNELVSRYNLQVDHIVPMWYGKQYNVPVFEMASVENLQLISLYDNTFTGQFSKGGFLPEVWFAGITGKRWTYSVDNGPYNASLEVLCRDLGVSYVKAASQLIKQAATEIKVGGVTIHRI